MGHSSHTHTHTHLTHTHADGEHKSWAGFILRPVSASPAELCVGYTKAGSMEFGVGDQRAVEAGAAPSAGAGRGRGGSCCALCAVSAGRAIDADHPPSLRVLLLLVGQVFATSSEPAARLLRALRACAWCLVRGAGGGSRLLTMTTLKVKARFI